MSCEKMGKRSERWVRGGDEAAIPVVHRAKAALNLADLFSLFTQLGTIEQKHPVTA